MGRKKFNMDPKKVRPSPKPIVQNQYHMIRLSILNYILKYLQAIYQGY